jgi:hypothetical protein
MKSHMTGHHFSVTFVVVLLAISLVKGTRAGVHHPKGVPRSLEEPAAMERLINQLSLRFPVALDNNWKTIDQYWTDKRGDFTSASMLIDRKGRRDPLLMAALFGVAEEEAALAVAMVEDSR